MKILMVNKFLHPKGGSETYMFQIGEELTRGGHQVEYFGMEHENRRVGNSAEAYTSNMDFHDDGLFKKIGYAFQTIYSWEARRKIRQVLAQFKPDVVHLGNINFQLTPSILYEIKKHGIPMVLTVHDSQVACPSHRLYVESTGKPCMECLEKGNYMRCVANRCIADSRLKSAIAAAESYYYHVRNTYNLVDAYICPSHFMQGIALRGGIEEKRLHVMHNPTDYVTVQVAPAEEKYALFFGRFSQEKGLNTLLKVAEQTPEVAYVFAGAGPMSDTWTLPPNVRNVGFLSGQALQTLIAQASFSICPSEWYENCPYSVIESQMLGTPVIGSRMGGIPEVIAEGKTGLLFTGGDAEALKDSILTLWNDEQRCAQMHQNCQERRYESIQEYTGRLLALYSGLSKAGVMR